MANSNHDECEACGHERGAHPPAFPGGCNAVRPDQHWSECCGCEDFVEPDTATESE